MNEVTRTGNQAPFDAGVRLQLENLSCSRGGRTLLSSLSLAVSSGEAVQVVGANGQGKTTLLRTLSGLQRPASGRVLWQGDDLHQTLDSNGDILYLAHENALNPDLTPRENLAALLRLHGSRRFTTETALDRLGMGGYADRLCRHLSAGQRRRSALARLALSEAGLWLLDEPAAALDADGREVLGGMIASHVSNAGAALYTTHEPLTLPGVTVRTLTL